MKSRETKEYLVNLFSVKQWVLIKAEAERIYPEWLRWREKEKPEHLDGVPELGQIYLRRRLEPYIIAGDTESVWAFADPDLASCWCLVLGHVMDIEWELVFFSDEDMKSLKWNRPTSIILPPLLNGETSD